MHDLRVFEVGTDEWCVGLQNAHWALPLSKADAISQAKLKAAQEDIHEIGIYNQTGELLQTLAV